MNAAEYLIEFFKKQNAKDAQREGFALPDVIAALDEVEQCIQDWSNKGEDVALMFDCLSRWKDAATMPFIAPSEFEGDKVSWDAHSMRFDRYLAAGDLMGLTVVANKMKNSSLRFTDDQRKKITKLITEARKALGDLSGSIPDGLALYLSRLMGEVETAIDEYDITGDFVLEKAFCRLREALDIAVIKTPGKDQDKWESVRDIFKELAIGFIIEAPSIVLGAAQVFPQIAS